MNLYHDKWLHVIVVILLIAVFGHLSVRIQVAEAQALQVPVLQSENQELIDRLSESSKIVTPDSVKRLSTLYIEKYFGKEAQKALKITTCESNLNNLVIHKNKNKTEDRGIFQINSIHAQQFKQVTGLDYETGALDFDANVKFAKWLFDAQGWEPWVCRLYI